MSNSEIYSFLEVCTLRAYATLKEEVQKLEDQGITDFDQLAKVTEEDLERWSLNPLLKYSLAEGNKIKKLPPPPQTTQEQPPLKETLDELLPRVEDSVQQILGKFTKEIEEVIDRKLSEFEKSYVLEVNVRPKKGDRLPLVVNTAGDGITKVRDSLKK